ncbi:MAG: DUF302 domain-containing protein [Planctomycetes bacterium]|nr:DUF302 domain-containing protein [Planctomycetota bacterium]
MVFADQIERKDRTMLRRTVLQKTAVGAGMLGVLSLAVFAQTTSPSAGGQSTGPGVVLKVSGSVEQTLDRIKKMVADNGMMVMGELHQGKVLAMTGLKVKSETIFVGNPNVGRQLFSEEPGAGLIVPIRINIYADAQGHTYVRYIPPSEQFGTFAKPKVNQIAKMLDEKLHKLVTMLPR